MLLHRHRVCVWVNYFNASARGYQLDLSFQTPLSMCVYIWERLFTFKAGNSYLIHIWHQQAIGTEERLNKHTNPHIYALTYIRRGLGQRCNVEHRCRQRPAHSDLCNFFNRAGRKLSFLSLTHNSHQNSLKSVSWLYSQGEAPSSSNSASFLSFLFHLLLLPPLPPLLFTPRQYLGMHSYFVASHFPLTTHWSITLLSWSPYSSSCPDLTALSPLLSCVDSPSAL